jgi:hypothetical protein
VNKYLILFHDQWERKPDVMAAWQQWFTSVGDRLVDSGNPLGAALEVTPAGNHRLSATDGAATGYAIASAESLEDAKRLLDGCPFRSSVRVYEAIAM